MGSREMMPHNIFITGGAGYVGSVLVPRLLELGHKVVVYDLFIYGDTLPDHEHLQTIKGDIRDKAKLLRTSKGCDILIHLACISNDPSFDLDPALGKSINYDAFQNVIDAVKENSIKRLLVASSTSQYGIKPLDVDVTEETPAEPITDYAKYKIACERLVEESDLGAVYTFVRPATLCGYAPRLRLDLSVNILTMHALVNKRIKVFGGEQMRPALNIKDMVRFYEFLIDAPAKKVNQHAFNISYGNMTIREIAELVKETLGDETIEFEVLPTEDKRSYHVSTAKLQKLGFACKYDLAEAVRSLRDAYNDGKIEDPLNNPLYHNIKRMQELKLT